MNKGKEKIVIAIITIIILVAVFLAFIVSNSQKAPASVTAQNDENRSVETVRGGYRWKVFGSEMIADSVDLMTYDYLAANTLVSKPLGTITFATTDSFTIDEVKYKSTASNEINIVDYRMNETLNNFVVDVPNVEGTYIYIIHLSYAKGEAEYGVKVVVTANNTYDIDELSPYVNTEITDLTSVKNILSKLPYSDKVESIIIDDEMNSVNIRYDTQDTTKEELINNTVALFVLMPELESVVYEQNNGKLDNCIFFAREEINTMYQRNVLEYASDTESWAKEVIYNENLHQESKVVNAYEKMILEALSGVQATSNHSSIVLQFALDETGNLPINTYEKKNLLNILSDTYENVMSTNKENIKTDGIVIKIEKAEKVDENDVVKISAFNNLGNSYKETYIITKDYEVIKEEDFLNPQEAESGEIVPSVVEE